MLIFGGVGCNQTTKIEHVSMISWEVGFLHLFFKPPQDQLQKGVATTLWV